jgi:hypothetical protein
MVIVIVAGISANPEKRLSLLALNTGVTCYKNQKHLY